MVIGKRFILFFAIHIVTNISTAQDLKNLDNLSLDIINVEIKNKLLLDELSKFQSDNKSYAKGVERAILINKKKSKVSVEYFITFVFDYYDLYSTTHINQVAKLNDVFLFLSIEDDSDFIIGKDFFLNIAKEKFPNAFTFYQKNEHYWPIPTTYHEVPVWHLTFKDNKLTCAKSSTD